MNTPQWCPVCAKDWPQNPDKAAIPCTDCWTKRVEDIRRRCSLPCGKQMSNLRLFVDLHMGFLYVIETEEHLSRLDPSNWTYEDGVPTPARSKITKSNLESIFPIDAVAAKVV